MYSKMFRSTFWGVGGCYQTKALCKKKHKKLKKHTYVYYMSVCLMSESCQQKKRWQAPGNIKHKNIVTFAFVVPL